MDHRTFQPADGTWGEYAQRGGLQSVLDPKDASGLKNGYIDAIHKAALLRAAQPREDWQVLDYGCGTGRMSRFFAPRVRKVIGVDITREMLEQAERESNPGNVEFRHISNAQIPVDSRSIDLLVTVYVLQYIVKQPEAYRAVLQEFARVLKPGGKLVLIEQVSPSGSMAASYSMTEAVTPKDYLDGMRFTPLHVQKTQVIRLGRPGRFERLTMLNSRVPSRLRNAAARLVVTRNLMLSDRAVKAQSYVDYMICGKAAG